MIFYSSRRKFTSTEFVQRMFTANMLSKGYFEGIFKLSA